MTAIVEHHDGRMELIHYAEFMAECHDKSIEHETAVEREANPFSRDRQSSVERDILLA